MDDALTQYDPGYVLVREGRIAEVGPLERGSTPQEPSSGGHRAAGTEIAEHVGGLGPAATQIDCFGCIVMPGLINCHTHLPMVAFRGLADDLPLMEWLEKHIWPAEGRLVAPQFCYDATLLAAAECIRGGVTCVNDMYLFERDVARALADAGLRGIVAEGIIQYPTRSAKTWRDSLAATERLITEYAGHPLIEAAVACHAPYSCTPEILQASHELAARHGALFHIHLHETADEPGRIDWLEL
jgi:5-methylthioadenosine/S-adenosylhomocysteine deaminase